MDSQIIRSVSEEQKDVVLDIPDFISEKPIDTQLNVIERAILNNVPGNREIEEFNNLAELERMCQNWTPEEWERVILHADSHLMLAEVDRRLENYEKTIAQSRAVFDNLSTQLL